VLAQRIANWVQLYTLYGSYRPFGVCAIISGSDRDGIHSYMIEPSGEYYSYFACASGKGQQLAKTELEKLNLTQLNAEQALTEIAKIIYTVHDDLKDKEFELELSWCCKESNYKHELVPKHIKDKAIAAAKAQVDELDDDE